MKYGSSTLEMNTIDLMTRLAGEARLADDVDLAAKRLVDQLGEDERRYLRRRLFRHWHPGSSANPNPDLRCYKWIQVRDDAERAIVLALVPESYRCDVEIGERFSSGTIL
jgi:hypothetical protein